MGSAPRAVEGAARVPPNPGRHFGRGWARSAAESLPILPHIVPVLSGEFRLVVGRAVIARNFAGQFWRSSPTKEQVLAVEALRGRSRRDSAFRQAVLGFLQLFLAGRSTSIGSTQKTREPGQRRGCRRAIGWSVNDISNRFGRWYTSVWYPGRQHLSPGPEVAPCVATPTSPNSVPG